MKKLLWLVFFALIYQYVQHPNGIELWTETEVKGTLVVGTYIALMRGVPYDKAIGSTFPVRAHALTTYR